MTKKPVEKIRCDACPVLCFIAEGKTGACDRYANADGHLMRVDPLTIVENDCAKLVPFLKDGDDWDGGLVAAKQGFVTAVGAGTTYPDYKPAPFIVSSEVDGVDMVTVVTEGIYSYCGVKVKVDTDRHLGPEQNTVRYKGEAVGHVTTGEYGSQMLSLGGVYHLTGGTKAEGRMTCEGILDLCNRKPIELIIDEGVNIIVEAGKAPIINGVLEERMRVGCGSAAIGMFAKQWYEHVDDVVVVDDHITGVLSEHQAGKLLGVEETGIKILGRRSTPGRYFQVAEPGSGWGGTNIKNPLEILGDYNPKKAKAGSTLMLVSTTGEHSAYFVLDDDLRPVAQTMPDALAASVARVQENCEPALCSVMFIGGAGGSLRAGVTENPVNLTKSVKDTLTYVSSGGAPVFIWPGGGITYMVDVCQMPDNSFGYVPTPALVAPIEFTMRLSDYETLGGHMGSVVSLDDVESSQGKRQLSQRADNPWPTLKTNFKWGQ